MPKGPLGVDIEVDFRVESYSQKILTSSKKVGGVPIWWGWKCAILKPTRRRKISTLSQDRTRRTQSRKLGVGLRIVVILVRPMPKP